ncbi:MAG: AraC family transcriptional regulator [Pseudomonadota bacterium]
MSTAISVCHGAFGRAALYRLDKSLITHAHREGHLIFHIEGNPSTVAINDQRFSIGEDCAAAVSPLEPHSFNVAENEPSVVLVLYIKPIWFLENSQSAEFTLRFGSPLVTRTSAIDAIVRRFTSLLLNAHNTEDIDNLLFSLSKLCYDQTWQHIRSPGLLQNKCSKFSDYRIRRSLRLMQQCISAEVEVESVARAVGLSRPHFFKLFKKQLGVTPNVYLNTLRSERAIDELVNTNKTVTSIAYDLGYSSQASFTRFFASNVGIAPSEYRRVADKPVGHFPM